MLDVDYILVSFAGASAFEGDDIEKRCRPALHDQYMLNFTYFFGMITK